jgi:alpha-beta hydrolase superfamily lysophospholipase
VFIGVDVRFDIRGHGKADGPRCKIASLDTLVDDMNLVLELVVEKFGSSTRIVVGGRTLVYFLLVSSGFVFQACIASVVRERS